MKSHRELARWYEPLEPDGSVVAETPTDDVDVPAAAETDTETAVADTPEVPAALGWAPRGGWARESGGAEPEEPAAPPTPLARPGYVGGWSDWMATAPEVDREPADLITLATPDDGQLRRGTSRKVIAAIVAGVVLALIIIGGVFLVAGMPGSGDTAAPPVVLPSTQPLRATAPSVATSRVTPAPAVPPPASAAAPGCRDERIGNTVTGAGTGNTGSGPDAILWFQHSYYVERSGVRAREAVAPNASVPAAGEIQKGIDSTPVGTTYCVRIDPMTEGRFSVQLMQYRPQATPELFKEVITTAVVNGRTVITGIGRG